jgi:alpha,alpha-trehalose phosphorylase
MTLTVEDGPLLSLSVRGRPVEVVPGTPVRLPMDTHGLDRAVAPESPALSGERREDGTVITASVPTP